MDAPPMADVCGLFEALDARCTCVIVVDPAGEILASYERPILPSVPSWGDPKGTVQH
jgi:hypothetical protein